MADHGFLTFRSDLCQFRIFLDLDAPSLVVCQMPVETVHVVQGKNIDELLDRIYREEVPGNIEVHTTIWETWVVVDTGGRKFDVHSFGHGGDRLTQGLHAIEMPALDAPAISMPFSLTSRR